MDIKRKIFLPKDSVLMPIVDENGIGIGLAPVWDHNRWRARILIRDYSQQDHNCVVARLCDTYKHEMFGTVLRWTCGNSVLHDVYGFMRMPEDSIKKYISYVNAKSIAELASLLQ